MQNPRKLNLRCNSFVLSILLIFTCGYADAAGDAEDTCWELEEGARYIKLHAAGYLARLRREENFDELESAMDCFLKSERLFPDGSPGVSAVYLSVEYGVFGTRILDDYIYILEQWERERPASIFVEFSKMKFLYDSAWRSLTRRSFRDSTDGAKLVMIRRLVSAFPVISRPSAKLRKTRLWHQLMLSILLDLDPQGEKARNFFLQATSRWPDYLPFYEIYVARKTPLWRGTWEDIDNSIREWAKVLEDSEGDAAYARFYILALGSEYSPGETLIKWSELKHSITALVEKHPTLKFRNFSLSLACYYGDTELVRELVTRHRPRYVEKKYWVTGVSAPECLKGFKEFDQNSFMSWRYGS